MTFSLQLSDDVIEVRDWVHQFAADVVRPPPRNGTSVRRPPGR
ncbi:acyl-CoA dehydrogenase domain protein [Mycobacterium avium subsp. avium 2285 (R)]|nr:acyl-CoA dehydrogenase domain protein [Mycobacterium avium subsp. avium 2285 (R)]